MIPEAQKQQMAEAVAKILCARTRPKLIGGERARYTEED